MKALNFNLNVLLRIRENNEQTALQEYARMLSDYSQKTGTVNTLRAELESCCAKFSDLSEHSVPAMQYAQFELYRESIETQYDAALAELSQAQEQLQYAWEQYLDARRDREVISRFQDKQRRAHAARERVLEQRELDEMAGRMGQSDYLAPDDHPEIWN